MTIREKIASDFQYLSETQSKMKIFFYIALAVMVNFLLNFFLRTFFLFVCEGEERAGQEDLRMCEIYR